MKTLKTVLFGYTQPTKDTHIEGAQNLANFVNNKGITKSDIVAITSDEDNSTFQLFYYSDDTPPALKSK